MTTFLLYESASGYGLFEVSNFDEIGNSVDEMQQSIIDVARFGKSVKLTAFKPFVSAANALEQINAVSESQVMHATDTRRIFDLVGAGGLELTFKFSCMCGCDAYMGSGVVCGVLWRTAMCRLDVVFFSGRPFDP